MAREGGLGGTNTISHSYEKKREKQVVRIRNVILKYNTIQGQCKIELYLILQIMLSYHGFLLRLRENVTVVVEVSTQVRSTWQEEIKIWHLLT